MRWVLCFILAAWSGLAFSGKPREWLRGEPDDALPVDWGRGLLWGGLTLVGLLAMVTLLEMP